MEVIGVVVSRAERVGAEHDSPLHLGAEALLTGRHVLLDQVVPTAGLEPVARAVVARQIRACLGRRDDVVGGQRHVAVRQTDLLDRGALLLEQPDRVPDRLLHRRFHARHEVFLWHAQAHALDALPERREIVGHRVRGAGGVARVVTGDGLQQHRTIGHVSGHRADLVKRRGEGDQPVAADPSIGWLEADDPGQRRRLADRTTRVAAQRADSLA